MAELQVPEEAVRRLEVCDADSHLHDRADTCVRAISAPVVAAELRRIAAELAKRPSFMSIYVLRQRAEELDPQPEPAALLGGEEKPA